jgi:hypothetical protein
MEEQSRQGSPESTDSVSVPEVEEDGPLVQAHTTTPDRVVFTEQGNKDGWIATDLVVDTWR